MTKSGDVQHTKTKRNPLGKVPKVLEGRIMANSRFFLGK
jgi:hypothetical protein